MAAAHDTTRLRRVGRPGGLPHLDDKVYYRCERLDSHSLKDKSRRRGLHCDGPTSRENPGREDFTLTEIVKRAERENLFGEVRPGVRVHASLHCVANRAPNPGRYRMLYATQANKRRLLMEGDAVHPQRNGKIFPDPRRFQRNTASCWNGPSSVTRGVEAFGDAGLGTSFNCGEWAPNCGARSMPTSTFADCGRVGSEPHFFRYQPVHLLAGGCGPSRNTGHATSRSSLRAP